MPKKKWDKPKLIVLARGDNAEMVLAACKTDSSGSNSDVAETNCRDMDCWRCFAPGGS